MNPITRAILDARNALDKARDVAIRHGARDVDSILRTIEDKSREEWTRALSLARTCPADASEPTSAEMLAALEAAEAMGDEVGVADLRTVLSARNRARMGAEVAG